MIGAGVLPDDLLVYLQGLFQTPHQEVDVGLFETDVRRVGPKAFDLQDLLIGLHGLLQSSLKFQDAPDAEADLVVGCGVGFGGQGIFVGLEGFVVALQLEVSISKPLSGLGLQLFFFKLRQKMMIGVYRGVIIALSGFQFGQRKLGLWGKGGVGRFYKDFQDTPRLVYPFCGPQGEPLPVEGFFDEFTLGEVLLKLLEFKQGTRRIACASRRPCR